LSLAFLAEADPAAPHDWQYPYRCWGAPAGIRWGFQPFWGSGGIVSG